MNNHTIGFRVTFEEKERLKTLAKRKSFKLSDYIRHVAIVESEKTAVIASVYLPEFLWLSTGGETNLSVRKCEPLKGRRVFLFPDLGAHQRWSKVAGKLSEIGIFVVVVDLLEKIANEKEKQKGLDLADYLVRYPIEEFQGGEGAGFL